MQTTEPDYYALLGLDRRCTAAQIRTAYRLLSKRHHPDVNPDADDALERTRELNAAYAVLSDPARRRAYDQELEEEPREAPARAARIERNISQDVHLRIEEFLRGTQLEVQVNDPANAQGPERYPLEVPPGTAPGTRFRLPRTAPFENGFVQLRVKVRPGARLKVRGADLRCDLRINPRRAAQGGTEMISGATGSPLRVAIPAGVPRGEIIRIPGEGLPKPRGGRGDMLVRITYRPEVKVVRSRNDA